MVNVLPRRLEDAVRCLLNSSIAIKQIAHAMLAATVEAFKKSDDGWIRRDGEGMTISRANDRLLVTAQPHQGISRIQSNERLVLQPHLAGGGRHCRKTEAGMAALTLAGLIFWSRLYLGRHSVAENMAGVFVGITGGILAAWWPW